MHQRCWRLRRWTEAGAPLLAAFDHASGVDADEARSEEARCLLRGLCVKPLVFYAPDGLGRGMVWQRRLRGDRRDQQRQSEKDRAAHRARPCYHPVSAAGAADGPRKGFNPPHFRSTSTFFFRS